MKKKKNPVTNHTQQPRPPTAPQWCNNAAIKEEIANGEKKKIANVYLRGEEEETFYPKLYNIGRTTM